MSAVASIDRDAWEHDRLAALQRFDVLDSPREEPFDRVTRLIRSIFGVSTGIVSMIDGHRQWYKSADGSNRSEVVREETFCRFPLVSGETLVVPNATLDPRFDFGGVRVPVTASFGLCVLDATAPDIETLLERADAALYEAKKTGRNRVVAVEPPKEDVRINARRVLKAGRIVFNNGASVVNCTVRWLSDEGAGMDVMGVFGIPNLFTLSIRSDGFERACKVVAQTDRHFDVRFI
jgi:hypothetical protein